MTVGARPPDLPMCSAVFAQNLLHKREAGRGFVGQALVDPREDLRRTDGVSLVPLSKKSVVREQHRRLQLARVRC
jgi:hypothetical protein